MARTPKGSTLLAAVGIVEHLTVSRGQPWPSHSCVVSLEASLAGWGLQGPWQRVQLIPVACLFLGNREPGTRTHFCGVLGLARNWLDFQLPESQPLVFCFGQLRRT